MFATYVVHRTARVLQYSTNSTPFSARCVLCCHSKHLAERGEGGVDMQSLGFPLAFRRALLQPLAPREVNEVKHACTDRVPRHNKASGQSSGVVPSESHAPSCSVASRASTGRLQGPPRERLWTGGQTGGARWWNTHTRRYLYDSPVMASSVKGSFCTTVTVNTVWLLLDTFRWARVELLVTNTPNKYGIHVFIEWKRVGTWEGCVHSFNRFWRDAPNLVRAVDRVKV